MTVTRNCVTVGRVIAAVVDIAVSSRHQLICIAMTVNQWYRQRLLLDIQVIYDHLWERYWEETGPIAFCFQSAISSFSVSCESYLGWASEWVNTNCVTQQSTALGPSFVLSFINNAVVRMTIMYYFFKMILKQKTLNTMQYLQLRFKVMLMRNKGQEMGQIF